MDIEISHDIQMGSATYRFGTQAVVEIGERSYIAKPCYLLYYDNLATVKIGKFTSIAPRCHFHIDRGGHKPDWISLSPMYQVPWPQDVPRPELLKELPKQDIIIGNNAWLGDGVRVLPGVVIGDGAIVGAGAVVAKSVPPYSVFVGNPGRVIKFRFAEEDRAFLEKTKWWDFPAEDIRKIAPALLSSDVAELKRRIEALNPAKMETSG